MKAIGYILQSCAVAAMLAYGPIISTAAAEPVALEGTLASRPVLQFNADTRMLVITIDRAQELSISAYVMTGKKVSKLACERFLTAGTHRINFNNQKLSNGVVIFKVEGSGFSVSKTINLAR